MLEAKFRDGPLHETFATEMKECLVICLFRNEVRPHRT